MKKFTTLFVLLLAALALSAQASTIQFLGWGPYGTQYPFHVLVDGKPNNLLCVTYFGHIGPNNVWSVTDYDVDQYGVHIGNPFLADELAWLAEQTIATGGANSTFQHVGWWLNDGHVAPKLSAADQAVLATVSGMTFAPNEFPGLMFYDPGTPSVGKNAIQTLVGETPEPSTLVLFGSAVLAGAGLLRKRLS